MLNVKVLQICKGLPLSSEAVTKINGVGQNISQQLAAFGYHTVFDVFEQFMLLKREKEAFQRWMHTSIHSTANSNNIEAMFEWLQSLWKQCYELHTSEQ